MCLLSAGFSAGFVGHDYLPMTWRMIAATVGPTARVPMTDPIVKTMTASMDETGTTTLA
jgi:hypothetical protein